MPALAGISAPLGAKRHKFIGCKDPRGDLNSRPLGPNDAVRPPFSTMNISVERLPECKARLSAEIPAETVKKTRREIVSTYASQAKVPGFRPGKIPSAVIEKRYADSIESELKDRLARSAYAEAKIKQRLTILGISEVEREQFEADGSYMLAVEVVTEPEVQIANYKGIPVEITKMVVTD